MKTRKIYVVIVILLSIATISTVIHLNSNSKTNEHANLFDEPDNLDTLSFNAQSINKRHEELENNSVTKNEINSNNKSQSSLNNYLRNIKQAFSKERSSSNPIETSIMDLLNTKKIAKELKIKALWGLLQKSESTIQFRYLAEALAHLRPIMLTDEIIDAYNQESKKENKIELLKILGEALLVQADDSFRATKDQLNVINEKQQINYNFLKEVMQSANDPDIADTAFSHYATLAPAAELLNTIILFRSSDRQTNLPASAFTNALLPKVFNNQETQNNLLPQILSETYKKEPEFYDNLYYWANYAAENLSPQTVTLIRETSTKTLKSFNSNSIGNDATKASEFVNNLKATVNLSIDKGISKEKALVDYTINEYTLNKSEPLKITIAITLADEITRYEFKKRKNEIIPSLQNALINDSSLKKEDKELIEEIITILNQ